MTSTPPDVEPPSSKSPLAASLSRQNSYNSMSTTTPLASTSALPSKSTPTMTAGPSPLQLEQGPRRRAGKGVEKKGGKTPWWRAAHELENKGSVARDHLASERTYLAWLRTSLSLASIGIAITQLFRLNTVTPSNPTNSAASEALYQQVADSLNAGLSAEAIAALQQLVLDTTQRLDAMSSLEDPNNNPTKYRHLGKPVGGTFIILALVFLIIGTHRFFKVQSALMFEPSRFPPSRRSVTFSTFLVAGVVLAAFTAILAAK